MPDLCEVTHSDSELDFEEAAFSAAYNPVYEAAFFYGLYLRGHPVERPRQDIDVPRNVLLFWVRGVGMAEDYREFLRQIYTYRRQVLACFDALVSQDLHRPAVMV